MQLRKLLLMLILLTVINARAEWILVYSDAEYSSYLDFSTIENSGDFLRIWHLLNFKSSQLIADTPNRSVEILWEMDCGGDRSRNLSSIWHADEMGGGSINYSDSISTDWKNNTPGTLSQHLWYVMCSTVFI
jgi:hypothetical protein